MIDYNKLITETQINIASNFRESHGSQPKVSEYKKEKKPKDFPKVGDTINVKNNSFKVVNSDYLRGRLVLVRV